MAEFETNGSEELTLLQAAFMLGKYPSYVRTLITADPPKLAAHKNEKGRWRLDKGDVETYMAGAAERKAARGSGAKGYTPASVQGLKKARKLVKQSDYPQETIDLVDEVLMDLLQTEIAAWHERREVAAAKAAAEADAEAVPVEA